MLLNANLDLRDDSACLLTYNEAEHWLQGTWSGFVDEDEAMRGALAYLRHAAQRPCPLLLNDNTQLRGPWFDSLDWLARVWAPDAARLGLHYVAHVVQADRHDDIILSRLPTPAQFELQVFQDLAHVAALAAPVPRRVPGVALGLGRNGGAGVG